MATLDLRAGVCTVAMARADTIIARLTLTDEGTPTDFTGHEVEAAVFDSDDIDATRLHTLPAAYADADPTAGIILVTFAPPADLPQSTWWRLWTTDDSDPPIQRTRLRGPFTVEGPGNLGAP